MRGVLRTGVAVVFAALLSTGCVQLREGAATTTTHVPRGEILAIGDSILVGVNLFGNLQEKLVADGWSAEVVAKEGEPTEWGLAQIEERETVPPVVVVALGTNPSSAVGTYRTAVTAVLDALIARGAQHIIWVPPHGGSASFDYTNKAALLREVAAARPEAEVLDWDATLEVHPRWFINDNVHLNNTGYGELAGEITIAVDRVAAGPGG
jgi:lysophospholipase L1-like esterase